MPITFQFEAHLTEEEVAILRDQAGVRALTLEQYVERASSRLLQKFAQDDYDGIANNLIPGGR